jgi:hypothetical protein
MSFQIIFYFICILNLLHLAPLLQLVQYTLISSILDKIDKMTQKMLEYPKNDTKLDSFRHLLEIRT